MALKPDEVLLTLGKDNVRIAENYEIRCSILTQPAGFALRLGHGGVVAELFKRYPKNTPFELRVNGRLMQTGATDSRATGGTGGSMATFKGRDVMGPLCSAYAPANKSFSNLSYHQLTSEVLDLVGLGDRLLIGTDAANRKAITGTVIVELNPASLEITKRTGQDATAERVTGGEEGTRRTSHKSITMKVGGRWYDWLKTQLDRAGLFLWATGEGAFILAIPTPEQKPAYRIERTARGVHVDPARAALGKVVDCDFEDDGERRFTKMIVYGKGGGRVHGRQKVVGEFVDQEMTAELGGENVRLITVHDDDVKTIKQAQHYARRRMAEINREAYRLVYTMAGHSTLESADGSRANWAANTVVEVDDREIGVRGNFWIEEVTSNGSPHQLSKLRLMRPQDMFFALEVA